jgi:hypothetical protein
VHGTAATQIRINNDLFKDWFGWNLFLVLNRSARNLVNWWWLDDDALPFVPPSSLSTLMLMQRIVDDTTKKHDILLLSKRQRGEIFIIMDLGA